jgi:hypothetical protein
MLEILALIMLSQTNSKAAKARGRSGGVAIAYTLGLWVGLELLGAILGGAMTGDTLAAYGFAIVFAIIGGVLSAVISRLGTVIASDVTQLTSPGAPQSLSQPPNALSVPAYPADPQAPLAFAAEKTVPVPQRPAPRFCTQCGTPIAENGVFCLKCGKRLVGGEAEGAPVPVPAPVPAAAAPAAAPVPAAAAPAAEPSIAPASVPIFEAVPASPSQTVHFSATAAPQLAPKQGKKRLPLIIGAAVAALVLVVVGIIVAVNLIGGLAPADNTAPAVEANSNASNVESDSGSTVQNDSAPADEADSATTGGGTEGSGTHYALTETFSAYNNSYTILGFAIEVDASGNTIVKCEGTGFEVLPMREGSFKVPVDCLLITANGTEHSWQGATTSTDGIEYEFDGEIDATSIIFCPADNDSKRVTVPLG